MYLHNLLYLYRVPTVPLPPLSCCFLSCLCSYLCLRLRLTVYIHEIPLTSTLIPCRSIDLQDSALHQNPARESTRQSSTVVR